MPTANGFADALVGPPLLDSIMSNPGIGRHFESSLWSLPTAKKSDLVAP
jgi:hypothetical protein